LIRQPAFNNIAEDISISQEINVIIRPDFLLPVLYLKAWFKVQRESFPLISGGFGCVLLKNSFANEVSVGYRMTFISWHLKTFLNTWKVSTLGFSEEQEKKSSS